MLTRYPLLDVAGALILVALFVSLLVAERCSSLRRRVDHWLRRVIRNFAMALPTFLVLRLLLIPVVVAVAAWAERNQVGLAHWLPVPSAVGGVVAFLLLDYTMYAWHWLNHRVPFLWRFHNVHHTDLDLDVTTAVRFHFGEMLFSVLFRSLQVVLAGATPLVALIYEICLEGSTQFHHSNLRLPLKLERVLSWFIMTPRAHGIHHSIEDRETNSNYSNLFIWWDRLHRTVRLDVPQDTLVVGVPTHRDPEEMTVWHLLRMPFIKQRRARPSPDAGRSHPPGGSLAP